MDITKKKVIFIDMDGTLIDTVSGNTFPEGVWDMKLKMEVFAQLKKLHPQAVLIVSNQGGIELGHVHPAMFQPKFIYVIACLQSYIGKLKDNDSIASLVKEYLIAEKDRYFMEKRLKCLMKTTRFTPARLQEEFPEAYLIYMDIITSDWNEKNDDAKKPASNLCDTIENIRATLKPDLKEALKNAKEEE